MTIKNHRGILFLLGAVMALCLLGAGSKPTNDEQAYAAACALLEAGEYEKAEAAFEAIPMYQNIQQKLEEARQKLNQSGNQDLVGSWKRVDGQSRADFYANGSCFIDDNSGLYSIKKNGINATVHQDFAVTPRKENNWQILTLNGQKYYRQNDYNKVIDIVGMVDENVVKYFDIVPVRAALRDNNGRQTGLWTYVLVLLKPEYKDKFICSEDRFGVEVKFDPVYKRLNAKDSKNWGIEEEIPTPKLPANTEIHTGEFASFYDQRNEDLHGYTYYSLETGEEIDARSIRASIICDGGVDAAQAGYITVPTNIQLVRADGMFRLYR